MTPGPSAAGRAGGTTPGRADVLGVVLAGGRSRRFGRDKALEPVDGTAMAVRVAGALRAGGAERVVAVGGDAAGLGALGLEVWPDAHPGQGPLGGLLTALDRADAPVVVVAACDLASLDGATVAAVMAGLAPDDQVPAEPARHPGAPDVAIARTDRREPLLAAWRVASALPVVAEVFGGGGRAVHAALDRLRVVEVPVAAAALRNVNHVGDLPR